MTQGTRTPNEDFEDLDALIVSKSLKPRSVRLGGRMWTLKRDFTAAEVVEFWRLADAQKNADAFSMLVGQKDGPELWRVASGLPTEMAAPLLRRMYKIAGLIKRDAADEESAGESSAS